MIRANLIRNTWLLVSLVFLVIILCSLRLPVFWDMYGVVRNVASIDGSFSFDIKNPQLSDNGHSPLYPFYLFLLFKLLGFKLWVAHLSVLPFIIGTIWQLRKLSLRFMPDLAVSLVLLLTLFVPALITQTIYFSQELAIVFVTLWLINALYDNLPWHVALLSVLLCLLNLRGIVFCVFLMLYFRKQTSARFIVFGVSAWCLWLIVHYIATGWLLSDEKISEFRTIGSSGRMVTNFAVCIWKTLDLGALFGWTAIALLSLRKKHLNEPTKLLLITTAAICAICIPLTNPVNNRYFLLSYLLVLPAFVNLLTALSKRFAVIATCAFAFVLFSSNNVTYPNRYGNAWDCSLKSIPYFSLRDELDAYVDSCGIKPTDVSAGFQVFFNDKYYRMNGVDREYSLLSDTQMPTTLYVADSNIPNNYNQQREDFLATNYTLIKEFRKDAVYLRLYRRSGS